MFRTWLAVLMIGGLTLPAIAQQADTIARAPKGGIGITMGILFFLLICVLVAAFMGSRRGHQD